jgi:hypothetical protein
VRINGDLAFDYDNRDRFDGHQYAFVVSDNEFDVIFDASPPTASDGAQPNSPTDKAINTRRGGRRFTSPT